MIIHQCYEIDVKDRTKINKAIETIIKCTGKSDLFYIDDNNNKTFF